MKEEAWVDQHWPYDFTRGVGLIQVQKDSPRHPPNSWVIKWIKKVCHPTLVTICSYSWAVDHSPRWRSPYEAFKTRARPWDPHDHPWIFSGVSQPIWDLSSPRIKEEWKVGSSELQPVLRSLSEGCKSLTQGKWVIHFFLHSFIMY